MRTYRHIVKVMTLLAIVAGSVLAQTTTLQKTVGPPIGEQIPTFTALDQYGRAQTLSTLVGPKGLLLLFVRSADW